MRPYNTIRVPTSEVTLDTWTLRVDSVDMVDIEIDETQVGAIRELVAHATGQRVSLGRTANMRGTLTQLMGVYDTSNH